MSVEDLLIHFRYANNRKQYYEPGETIEGVVSLHLRAGLRTKGVSVHFLGEATVSWEALHKKKTYSDSETHLDSIKSLLDLGFDQTASLPRGLHEFGFRYTLPTHLPSTFNGIYGGVTYLAKARVDAEDDQESTVTSEPFLVLRRPELPMDVYEEKKMKKTKFYLGLESGQVKVICSIDSSAAIPGKHISIDAEVANWSGKEITLIQAALVQESHFYAKGKEIAFRQYLNKRTDEYDVSFRRGRRWRHVLLQVPPYLADSGLETCRIMDVNYHFQFKVQIEGKDDISLETPVYVGRSPGQESFDAKHLLLGRMWRGISLEDEPRQLRPPTFQLYRDRSMYSGDTGFF